MARFWEPLNKIAVVSLLCILSMRPQAQATPQNSFGFYFDSGATVNCLSNGMSTPLSGYLILHNINNLLSLGGWEATVRADPGIYLYPTQLSFSGFSVRTAPEYSVGLPVPMPISATMVVATFSVYATSPGGIYVHAISNPSLPNATGIVCADGVSPGVLCPLAYAYGSPTDPVARIAASACDGYVPGVPELIGVGPTSTTVSLAEVDNAQYIDIFEVTIPYGTEPGALAPVSGQYGMGPRRGIADFDVLPDGGIVFLDVANSRLAFYTPDLRWDRNVAIPEGILVNRLFAQADTLWVYAYQGSAYDVSDGYLRPAHTRISEIDVETSRGAPAFQWQRIDNTTQTATVAIVDDGDSTKIIMNVNIAGACDLVQVTPLTTTLVNNNIYIEAYCMLSSNPIDLAGHILVLNINGTVAAHIPFDVPLCYSLPRSLKMGRDGSIVRIAQGATGVEVTRWSVRAY